MSSKVPKKQISKRPSRSKKTITITELQNPESSPMEYKYFNEYENWKIFGWIIRTLSRAFVNEKDKVDGKTLTYSTRYSLKKFDPDDFQYRMKFLKIQDIRDYLYAATPKGLNLKETLDDMIRDVSAKGWHFKPNGKKVKKLVFKSFQVDDCENIEELDPILVLKCSSERGITLKDIVLRYVLHCKINKANFRDDDPKSPEPSNHSKFRFIQRSGKTLEIAIDFGF